MGVELAGSGAVLAAGLCGLAVYETYALATHRVPLITYIVRGAVAKRPHMWAGIFGAAGMLAGWLIGHLGK